MKKILILLLLLSGILFSPAVFAAQPQVILFCSGWNLKCRDARSACTSAAKDLGYKFVDLDIDQAYSQQKADELGLNIPPSIPYIYLINNNGDLVRQQIYKGETSQDLKQGLFKL